MATEFSLCALFYRSSAYRHPVWLSEHQESPRASNHHPYHP
ncbi:MULTISPECIES: hypothetical protein [Pseudomonas]|nr:MULTISPECIES: hypothetical protein [Pseudomonas]MBG6127797.1 hypothetical protein [Pseudomonas sp. M2]